MPIKYARAFECLSGEWEDVTSFFLTNKRRTHIETLLLGLLDTLGKLSKLKLFTEAFVRQRTLCEVAWSFVKMLDQNPLKQEFCQFNLFFIF